MDYERSNKHTWIKKKDAKLPFDYYWKVRLHAIWTNMIFHTLSIGRTDISTVRRSHNPDILEWSLMSFTILTFILNLHFVLNIYMINFLQQQTRGASQFRWTSAPRRHERLLAWFPLETILWYLAAKTPMPGRMTYIYLIQVNAIGWVNRE